MKEIVVTDPWRDRLMAMAGDRKKTIIWAVAVAATLLLCIGYARATARPPVVAKPATATVQPTTVAATPATVFVHVAGAVAQPGLYSFPPGLRVADAIETAGGPLARGDLDALNLADPLTDGMKIEVPVRGKEIPVTASTSPTPSLIDLNTADVTALETVPGIGPVTATAIVQHRTEIGQYENVEQLLDVTGIGPATLESLLPYVTV